MTFTVEYGYDEGNSLKCASEYLQDCIDYVNQDPSFPTVAKIVVFSIWENKKRTMVASFDGWRGDGLDGNKKFEFTDKEINNSWGKF